MRKLGWKVGKVLQWATVVLDEGHRIKNHNTGIYNALLPLGPDATSIKWNAFSK